MPNTFKFAKNNNGFLSYKIKVIRERILVFRHIYANSLNKFSSLINFNYNFNYNKFVTYFLNFKIYTRVSDDVVMKNIEPESIT